MKIYSDGEYVKGKRCFRCGTKDYVFYDRKSDFFTCTKCLYEFEDRLNGTNRK